MMQRYELGSPYSEEDLMTEGFVLFHYKLLKRDTPNTGSTFNSSVVSLKKKI
jgi:hypothetical protein